MSGAPAEHLRRLAGSDWAVWQWAGLRGAGFPASLIDRLAAPEAAQAADALLAAEARFAQGCAAALAAVEAGPPDAAALRAARALRRTRVPAGDDLAALPDDWPTALPALHTALEHARAALAQGLSAAQAAVGAHLRAFAREARFREAVLWQNRAAVHSGLDALLRKPVEPRTSKVRQHEQLVATYVQRYCTKNDTIGFFGPVGWAHFVDHGPALQVQPGAQLLARRAVSFEQWGIDALAAALGSDARLRPWCVPRRAPLAHLEGSSLYLPGKPPLRVPPGQIALLRACDGRRTAQAIAAELLAAYPGALRSAAQVFELLEQLAAAGLIVWTFDLPLGPPPEQALRRRLELIGPGELREPALATLHALEQARARVADAAGQPDALDAALADLEAQFEQYTGGVARRAEGATYAGRTLVYEDCRRDCTVAIGPALLDQIGPALALVLDSARWYAWQVQQLFRQTLRDQHRALAQAGGDRVDLWTLWQQLQIVLGNRAPRLVEPLVAALGQRWAELLDIPAGAQRADYRSAALRERARAAFAAPRPGRYFARYHSPDLMIAAGSPEAVGRGDYLAVLGELHVAANTLRAPFFVQHHPDPDGLVRAYASDVGGGVAPLIPRAWPHITSRTRIGLAAPDQWLLLFSNDAHDGPGERALPIGALVVEPAPGGPLVRSHDGRLRFDAVELLAELLSFEIADDFKLLPPAPHTPRVTIDRLVVARETWRFAPDALAFCELPDEAARFVGARRWRLEHGLPERCFVKAPVETKPFFVDLASPALVEFFAKTARRTRERGGPGATLAVSELLPDFDQLWLSDAAGQRYTAELRVVAVDTAEL